MGTGGGIFISYRRTDTNWAIVAMRQHLGRDLPGPEFQREVQHLPS